MTDQILIGLFSAIIVGYLGIYIIQQRKQQKVIHQAKVELEKLGTFKKLNRKDLLIIGDKTYEVIFYYAPMQSDFTINSRNIWEIKVGKESKIVDVSSLLSSKYPKIVIVYPLSQRIKRFINENEMVFINYTDYFYDMYILRLNDLTDFIEAYSK